MNVQPMVGEPFPCRGQKVRAIILNIGMGHRDRQCGAQDQSNQQRGRAEAHQKAELGVVQEFLRC